MVCSGNLLFLPAGSGEKFFSKALIIEVDIDFVVGQDVRWLQGMDNVEASCIFYVKIGKFNQYEQSKICLLTVNKIQIVRLTVKHDLIVSLHFM